MDSLRAFDEQSDYGVAEDDGGIEVPPEIGLDERRMHVRAYNYWVSLLDGRAYPSIKSLDPEALGDFGPNSVLLDFSEGGDDPRIAWLGDALREECDLIGDVRRISEVPKRSLLSRLTDHYMQIIANKAPIGFEAEFVGQRGKNTMYRGILMPFSSTGETIDFIYGVINWKEIADSATASAIAHQASTALAAAAQPGASPVWADGPNAEPLEIETSEPACWDEPELDLDAGLADRLGIARDSADAARGADQRSRASLYRALGLAYDFALAAEADGEAYAELLEDAGLKAQARAPMTPVVKLVFGSDYDKGRLTEFAAALSWARREALPAGALRERLESDGLKTLVQAERRARRPEPKPDSGESAREALRSVRPLGHVDLPGEAEFVLLIARRDEVGGLAVLAPVADEAMLERAIRKAAA
ncbi:MAG: PAS domain-containing protein [Allosphingosinicella sp.]